MNNIATTVACICKFPEAPKMCPTTLMETKVDSFLDLYAFFNGNFCFSFEGKNYKCTKFSAVPLTSKSDGTIEGGGTNKRGFAYRLFQTTLLELDATGQEKSEGSVCNKTIFIRNIVDKLTKASGYSFQVGGKDVVNDEKNTNGLTGRVTAAKLDGSNEEFEEKVNWFVDLLNSNAKPIEANQEEQKKQ